MLKIKKFKLSKSGIAGIVSILITASSLLPISGETIKTSVGTVTINSQLLANKTVLNSAPKEVVAVSNNPSIALSKYGKITVDGMTATDYATAMDQKWTEIIPEGKPINIDIDLTKNYSYADMEKIMFNLAKYDGVHLYKIGKSEKGRNLYSLNIDFESDLTLVDGKMIASDTINNKEVLLCTGQVHAREFAGSIYIIKQFNDLVKKAQTDAYTKALLQNVIFTAVPCVNPDGREAIIAGASSLKASNANGVDPNRNFPSVNAGQLTKGTAKSIYYVTTPGNKYFDGYTLGSEAETQAMMRWFDFFVPFANSYVDYHQQGGGIYMKKEWDSKVNQATYTAYAQNMVNYLNKGISSKKYTIRRDPYYGLDGVGGYTTDYATSIAIGMKWSETYGRMVLKDDKGNDIPLLVVKYMDNPSYKQYYHPTNLEFAAVTLEIGREGSTGYSKAARNLIAKEYTKYRFDGLLTYRAELALGTTRINQLKAQIKKGTSLASCVDDENSAINNEEAKTLTLKR